MKKVIIIVVMSVVLFASGALAQNTLFTDVPEDHSAAEAITWAVQNGITNGISDTEFGPDQSLTRAQMATMLHRYDQVVQHRLRVTEHELDIQIAALSEFDNGVIEDYAKKSDIPILPVPTPDYTNDIYAIGYNLCNLKNYEADGFGVFVRHFQPVKGCN